MSKRKPSPTGSRWNRSVLISAIVILIFLALPWIFTKTSTTLSERQVTEEVGLVKTATDLLSPRIWWPLLLCSLFLLVFAFYKAIRSSSSKPAEIPDLPSAISTKRLGLLGGLSLVVYVLFFLLPFPLHRYYDLRRVSMGWIADRSWVAAITLSLAIVVLFLLYISAYRLTLHQNSQPLWTLVLLGALFFGLINLFVFPISSTDLYDYVSRGRISGIHGGNPLVQVPNDYPEDPYIQLAAWKKEPSAYGPLWEVLSGFIGRTSGGPLWNDMLGYKGIALLSYLLSTVTIAAILQRVAPHRGLTGTLLFAWNPLVILEGVANAHNDMIMMAFLLGGFWILSQVQQLDNKDKFSKPDLKNLIYAMLALLLLTLSVLVKFIPIFLLPPFLLYLLALWKGWKKNVVYVLLYLLPMMLVVFIYYQVFWKWPEISNTFIHRMEMFRMSLASLTNQFLGEFIQEAWAQGIASWFFLGAFVVGYLLILVRMADALGLFSSKDIATLNPPDSKVVKFFKWVLPWTLGTGDRKPWDILVSASLHILLIYLLLGSLWFWPWYLIWPMALLTLSKNERLITILMVVSCAGQLSTILWNFVWYWMGIEWHTLHIVENLVLALLLLPPLAIHLLSKQWRKLDQTSMENFMDIDNTRS
ncbi:MAG: hypothetical protein A2Z14_08955 [Chloroflexi bacterium RBG_16_48_8]|nr:MAG: hypothetical protein A2Z14_08955 [Chloroflexi bacterium RBG_16_48_8]